MNKPLKFLAMVLFLPPFASYLMYSDYMAAVNFEAVGTVVEAKWNTKNHKMSLFRIDTKTSIKPLHHSRVSLTPDQIKVGDRFSKMSGSKMCVINDISLRCVM